MKTNCLGLRWWRAAGLACLAAATAATAQTVEKVVDLTFANSDGVGVGGYAPLDRFTQVGSNLWFTTSKGGAYDAGTISRFDLVTREVVQVASFDNLTGKASESALLVIGDEAYFTTVNGGSGNKGTIAKVSLATGAITTLYHFPADSSTGATPRAGLTRIGEELWTTTSLGGTANRGVIVKYNLTNGLTTVVTNLDGPQLGGQAYAGLVEVDGAYYFTTAVGGDTFATTTNIVSYTLPSGEVVVTTNNLSLGAGTLMRLTFDRQGQPAFTRLVNLRGGFEQFAYSEPVRVGSNTLYFSTIGPNPTPGAIMRYDLATGACTNVWLFPTNAAASAAFGTRPGYNGLVAWLDELYFLNRLGGVSNVGAVLKFNTRSGQLTKLADLEGNSATSLGSAASGYNSGLVVEETNRFYAYFPVAGGGANKFGTIIRIALPPPPIVAGLAAGSGSAELTLTWTGGYPPFTVQGCGEASGRGWTNVVEGLTSRSVTVSGEGGQAFYRVVGRL